MAEWSLIDGHFWSFVVAITLLSLTPGVDTLLVIRNTARGGVRDGIATSVAICCGLFVHATVSALGISLILLQSAVAFNVLKLAGAAYLIWLGVQSLRVARRGRALAVDGAMHGAASPSRLQAVKEGFVSNVLNPKTIVFYMAFLPQFIAPGDPALVKSLWLAGVHFVIANIWQISVVLMVGRANRWLASARVGRALNGLTGSVLVAFGIKLAFEQRP
ncbi:LysE family translocator [Vreelandella subglaciescola]|uniref:Resistance to homoserine/threonine (RhtB) family protein n=1 Tax=Vreelandella subglaciescola TaxID=29571 RepID=A0A1M7F535_9GAMM|nr:LysE family translocator [Halomonas subglaciescola]SHL99172.1 resistance to homoserine/threonine (RhtB) family protein [Halomonas subglaciescola]